MRLSSPLARDALATTQYTTISSHHDTYEQRFTCVIMHNRTFLRRMVLSMGFYLVSHKCTFVEHSIPRWKHNTSMCGHSATCKFPSRNKP